MMIGRGCVGKCSYCSAGQWVKMYRDYGAVSVRPHRIRPIDHIIEELKLVKAKGFEYISFIESYLTGPKPFLMEFFKRYKKEIGLRFSAYLLYSQISENPDILDCMITINLSLEKQERMLVLDFQISGNMEVTCDRCLENFNLPINSAESYYYKFGEERKEESEDVMIIPESEYQINVAELIFDYVSLTMPIRKVHPDDEDGNSTCNKDILSKLNEFEESPEMDPRWEALKKLKSDNNK